MQTINILPSPQIKMCHITIKRQQPKITRQYYTTNEINMYLIEADYRSYACLISIMMNLFFTNLHFC